MRDIKLVNLLPHPINVLLPDGTMIEIPRGEQVYRLTEKDEPVGAIGGIPLKKRTFTATPLEDTPGTVYIVSLPAAMGLKVAGFKFSHALIVCPDTGADAIRDEQGNIKAVRGFITIF